MRRYINRRRDAFVATLLRGTLLIQPSSDLYSSESFVAGDEQAFLFGGPSVKWWRTVKRHRAEIALSRLIIDEQNLVSASTEWCVKIIRDLLREICLVDEFFNSSMVLDKTQNSLFECLSLRLDSFADYFCKIILSRCKAAIKSRLTVWPVMPRLVGVSFYIESLGAGLVRKNDLAAWERHTRDKFAYARWDQKLAQFSDAPNILGTEPFEYLAIAMDQGTTDWCYEKSASRIRSMLSVVVAHFPVDQISPLTTALADPPCSWIQFADIETQEGWLASSSDPVLPFLARNLEIDSAMASEIQSWFLRHSRLDRTKKVRVEKCAYYINMAMNARHQIRFVFYYIALDALFGERGNVERTIQSGIDKFAPEFSAMCPWLFNLRNELLHGGSRTLKEWPSYERYEGHFLSLPETDIELTALHCLRRFCTQFA